jgi:hypothetical protein
MVVVLQLHLAYMSGSLFIRSRRPRQMAPTIANNDHGIVIDLEGLEDLLQPTRFDMGPFVVRVLLFGLYTWYDKVFSWSMQIQERVLTPAVQLEQFFGNVSPLKPLLPPLLIHHPAYPDLSS